MFIRSRLLAQATAIVLASTAAASMAAEQTTPTRGLPTGGHSNDAFIPSWDADRDGQVPRAEYDGVRTQRFASADEDGNGSLSADEYVNEYAVRLDRQIADERKASIEQTHTRFDALDKDKDGFISHAEYDASGAQSFARLDDDKDGRIVRAAADKENERPRREGQRSVIGMPTTHTLDGFIGIYDADGDDVVTREQFDAERARAFAATDADRDGKLSPSEYLDEFADRLDRRISTTRQAQLRQGHVRFESIDADRNGNISRDEYVAMSARMFERADGNKDGVVSSADPAPVRERREPQEKTAAATTGSN